MKVHLRICDTCSSKMEETRTRSLVCRVCADRAKLNAKFDEDRKIFEELGYLDVKNPTLNQHKQRVWTFTHPSGTELTMTFNNFRTLCKRNPNRLPGAK